MLIVLGEAKLGKGALEEGLEALTAMVDATRKEEGCISYAFAQDVLDDGKLLIVEQWANGADLMAHVQTPHMAAFQKALAGLDITVSEVLKYEADEGAPLM